MCSCELVSEFSPSPFLPILSDLSTTPSINTPPPGTLDSNNQRTDVDVDYPLLVKIWDENMSWYIEDNTGRCQSPSACRQLLDDEDEDFTESNYMAAINGYMYGQLPDLTVRLWGLKQVTFVKKNRFK